MTEPERLTAEDRAHLAYQVDTARLYEQHRIRPNVTIDCDTLIRLAACLERVEEALGAYAGLACWRPDHEQPGSPLVIWDGRGNGPDLAREALGLPKMGDGGEYASDC